MPPPPPLRRPRSASLAWGDGATKAFHSSSFRLPSSPSEMGSEGECRACRRWQPAAVGAHVLCVLALPPHPPLAVHSPSWAPLHPLPARPAGTADLTFGRSGMERRRSLLSRESADRAQHISYSASLEAQAQVGWRCAAWLLAGVSNGASLCMPRAAACNAIPGTPGAPTTPQPSPSLQQALEGALGASSREGSLRGSRLALAALAARTTPRSSSLSEMQPAGEGGGAAQQQQQQQQQQQPIREGAGSPEPDAAHRRRSSEEVREEEAQQAAVYDRLVRTLSRNSMRGRSATPRTAPGEAGGGGGGGGEGDAAGGLSRSSSQRGQMRSSSLAAAAQQLTRLSSQGEVASPRSGSAAPSPPRPVRMTGSGGLASPPPLTRMSSRGPTQPTSPAQAGSSQPALPPSPFGGEALPGRQVQSMPPPPPFDAPAAPAPPASFDAPAEARSAPHGLQAAAGSAARGMPSELDPYCSRFLSGLVGDEEEAG